MNSDKKRKHIFWIVGIALSYVLMEYYMDRTIAPGTFVKGLIFASVLEFGQYCRDVYIKDNEEIKPN